MRKLAPHHHQNNHILVKIIFAILALLLVGLVAFFILNQQSVNHSLVEQKSSLIAQQTALEANFQPGGASFDNLQVILNPYQISPLTALVIFETNHAVAPTVKILGKDRLSTFTHTFATESLHYLPIFGLYPGQDNQVEISYAHAGETKTHTLTITTEPLVKHAGILKESDELIEDADWLVSAIQNRGIPRLALVQEEYAISKVLGTSGVGAGATTITEATLAAAIGKVLADSGYAADGIVMNPVDYAALIASSLTNSRTLFGADYKTFLGIPVVQSVAIDSGLALVGCFRQGATFVQKGGIRVEATNSNEDDFTHNLVAIRIESRELCAVRLPKAFCTVGTSGE